MASSTDSIARNAWLLAFQTRKFVIRHSDELEKGKVINFDVIFRGAFLNGSLSHVNIYNKKLCVAELWHRRALWYSSIVIT